MRIAMVGWGRMAQAVARVATQRGHTIALTLGSGDNPDAAGVTADRMADVDLAFEFTRPEAVVANLTALARLGIPTVCGTTGWLTHLPAVTASVTQHRTALLHAPNFSIGVQLFLRTATDLAARMAGQPFDGFVTESHHAAKCDAPSGTALALVDALHLGDSARIFPTTSVRGGHDPGTHTVVFDAPFETIRLEHAARHRDAFAVGAVTAAEWLRGRAGVFTFAEMLFGEGA